MSANTVVELSAEVRSYLDRLLRAITEYRIENFEGPETLVIDQLIADRLREAGIDTVWGLPYIGDRLLMTYTQRDGRWLRW
jgi:hypothetical protein